MDKIGNDDTKILPDIAKDNRRDGIIGDFESISGKKRRTKNINDQLLSMGDSQTSSFLVPPVNKELKNIAKEELKNDDNIIFILACLTCIFAIADNEQTFQRLPSDESYCLYLRFGILIFSIASILWVVRRYQILLVLKVLRYNVSVNDTLFDSGLYKRMIPEILINCIFSPPGFDYFFDVGMLGYTITYSIDDICTFFALLRLYTLIRLFAHHSVYTQPTAETVCERNGEKASSVFALKCFIQDSPFVGIGVLFVALSLFSAIVMRIAERPDRLYPGAPTPSALYTVADNLWVIFFTTTTVGYGNIYPVTHPGRAICILACIFGNMYLGMLVVAIRQKMDHSDNENLAYAWIYRHYSKENSRKNAVRAIRNACKLYMLGKKWGGNPISKIKPNGEVLVKGKLIKFDLNYLSEQQYLKKCQIYREMKKELQEIFYHKKDARNTGQKDIESIKLIEDTVRVDTSAILKKINPIVTREHLLVNSSTISSQISIEKSLSQVCSNANTIKRSLKNSFKRSMSLIGPNSFHKS
jgi:Ion channel